MPLNILGKDIVQNMPVRLIPLTPSTPLFFEASLSPNSVAGTVKRRRAPKAEAHGFRSCSQYHRRLQSKRQLKEIPRASSKYTGKIMRLLQIYSNYSNYRKQKTVLLSFGFGIWIICMVPHVHYDSSEVVGMRLVRFVARMLAGIRPALPEAGFSRAPLY